MNKCDKCSKNITKRNPGLECIKCEKTVHGNNACSGLTNKQLAALRAADNLEWTCTECHNTSIRRSSFFVPEEDEEEETSPHLSINVKQLLNDVSKEMEKTIQREMKECMRSLQHQSDKMDEVLESLDFCKQSILELKRKNTELANKNTHLETRIGALEQRLHETEQQKLCDQIEIHNIQGCEKEAAKEIVENIAQKLKLPADDILNIQMKTPPARRERQKVSGSIIILKMKNEDTQQKWISTSKTLKLTMKDIITNASANTAHEAVFIRESLTPYNKGLLWNAKQQLKSKFKFIWCKKGVIRVRKDIDCESIIIRSPEDINKLV